MRERKARSRGIADSPKTPAPAVVIPPIDERPVEQQLQDLVPAAVLTLKNILLSDTGGAGIRLEAGKFVINYLKEKEDARQPTQTEKLFAKLAEEAKLKHDRPSWQSSSAGQSSAGQSPKERA